MSTWKLYVEGGGDNRRTQERCREGFHKLLENNGFKGRLPKITASGGRNQTFNDFKTAQTESGGIVFVSMLVDSEDPVTDGEKPWKHLQTRDGWTKPTDATDEQVFLMTTCMETWIVADRVAVKAHFDPHGNKLRESALPPTTDLESRARGEVQKGLIDATSQCQNTYAKGARSYEILGKLKPEALNLLPSFARMIRILNERLQ